MVTRTTKPFLKDIAYNWIEDVALETFCLVPSGSSIQPDKPTIINVIANKDNTFFIMSSKGFYNYFKCTKCLSTGNLYHGLMEKCNHKIYFSVNLCL